MSPVSLFFTLAIAAAPDPRLAPQQVVEIVAAALRHNNSPIPNAGVFTAYRFASPANHTVTGPYGRFLRGVKAPLYAPMLDDYPQDFEPVTNDGDRASLTMRIRTPGGTVLEYRWDLSRQAPGSPSRLLDGGWRQPHTIRARESRMTPSAPRLITLIIGVQCIDSSSYSISGVRTNSGGTAYCYAVRSPNLPRLAPVPRSAQFI